MEKIVKAELFTVLLVEDNKIEVMVVQRAFQRRGFPNPIRLASDGIEALEILRGESGQTRLEQPYVILLDLNMPRMGGLEFLEEIRKDDVLKKSIVFVLTTSEDDRDKKAAYEQCIAGYFSKYDSRGDFLNVIQVLEQFQASIHFPPKD
jgi:CheY-like chemotaxis protein